MQGNDIAYTPQARFACKFEGVLMRLKEEQSSNKKGWFRRKETEATVSGKWRPIDMGIKSLDRAVNVHHMPVTVVTFMGDFYADMIENWLFRKGISPYQVISYDDVWELREDLKYDREMRVYITDSQEEQDVLGIQRARVVTPDREWHAG